MTDRDRLADELAELIDGAASTISLDEVETRARLTPSLPPRRMRRRTVAVALALVLVATITVVALDARREPSIAPTGPSPATSTSSLNRAQAYPSSTPGAPGEMGAIGPGAGWALDGIALYRTDDDGGHWRDITPPKVVGQDPVARIGSVDFLDPDHVWLTVALNHEPFTIYHSTDGGSTWQAVCIGNSCASGAALTFIDVEHGWALDYDGAVSSTSDGGSTWEHLGTAPFTGPMHFVNLRDGWGVSDPSGNAQISGLPTKQGGVVYRTRDGGRTWKRAEISSPSLHRLVRFGVPQFFGSDGVIAGWVNPTGVVTSHEDVAVYVTHDGGDTWTPHLAPTDPLAGLYGDNTEFTAPYFPFSASSPSEWMLFVGPNLYTTHDAGQHWQTLTPTPAIGRVYSLALTSASSAWAEAMVPTCTRLTKRQPCVIEAFLHTTDGGRTWPAFYPH